jgi:tetratricopeptide (TPR) repeat protein
MFEVFVITSTENDLVKEYEDIGKKNLHPDVACSIISSILFRQGAKSFVLVRDMLSSGKINERKLSADYKNAMNLIESAAIIDPNQASAYVHLASLRAMLKKNADALKYVRQGLEAIKRIREENIPFHKSSVPAVQSGAEQLDDIEKMLLAMKNEFSG